jgi:hypothetical protein
MKYCWVIAAVFILSLFQAQLFAAENQDSLKRFTTVDSDVVLDTETGLMWASKDNGVAINWYDAEKYCEKFDAGGFQDWRLPRQEELEGLYDPKEKNSNGFHVNSQINITACCPWASDDSLNSAAIFSFRTGKRPWGFKGDTGELRVLPVRGGKPHLR